jgi:hypothetical protein
VIKGIKFDVRPADWLFTAFPIYDEITPTLWMVRRSGYSGDELPYEPVPEDEDSSRLVYHDNSFFYKSDNGVWERVWV